MLTGEKTGSSKKSAETSPVSPAVVTAHTPSHSQQTSFTTSTMTTTPPVTIKDKDLPDRPEGGAGAAIPSAGSSSFFNVMPGQGPVQNMPVASGGHQNEESSGQEEPVYSASPAAHPIPCPSAAAPLVEDEGVLIGAEPETDNTPKAEQDIVEAEKKDEEEVEPKEAAVVDDSATAPPPSSPKGKYLPPIPRDFVNAPPPAPSGSTLVPQQQQQHVPSHKTSNATFGGASGTGGAGADHFEMFGTNSGGSNMGVRFEINIVKVSFSFFLFCLSR